MPGTKKDPSSDPEEQKSRKAEKTAPKPVKKETKKVIKTPRVKVIKGVLATSGERRPGPSKKEAPVEMLVGKVGPDHLTRFEKARILGARALQLSFGAPPMIPISSELMNAMTIARAELESRSLPISIRRTLPSGKYQNIALNDLM